MIRFVANGLALPDHEIRVADGNDKDVPQRVRGRVLFRGPSKTSGYFRNPEATSAVTTNGGWMDSGDLGYQANGELYITGREKDTIIKGGHNISPQEIELAAAGVPGVRRGCVSAFGTLDHDTGTERLIVVAETRTRDRAELDRIEREVVKIVGEEVGMPPDQVELVPPQTIPKTSSGKIRRNETRKLYEAGELVGSVRPPWMQIARLWAENAGAWARLAVSEAGSKFGQLYRENATLKTGIAFGLLARLMPTRQAAARVARRGARLMLAVNRRRPSNQLERPARRGAALRDGGEPLEFGGPADSRRGAAPGSAASRGGGDCRVFRWAPLSCSSLWSSPPWIERRRCPAGLLSRGSHKPSVLENPCSCWRKARRARRRSATAIVWNQFAQPPKHRPESSRCESAVPAGAWRGAIPAQARPKPRSCWGPRFGPVREISMESLNYEIKSVKPSRRCERPVPSRQALLVLAD